MEGAAIPTAALTALQGLRDIAYLSAGQHVLVYGASGGVGHFAVQVAKYLGSEVTAVTSTANLDWVQALGADHLIDYTKEDFTRSGVQYMDLLRDLAESGKLRPHIEKTFPLAEIAAAHRHLEAGHTKGKIIVEMHPV